MSVRVRYAPSPTGAPHIGNLRTALYNWLLARHTGGTFIARLEDTDRTPGRYVPEGIYDLEASMRFFSALPDEWWVYGGPASPYIQSHNLPYFQKCADGLIADGKAYRCYCTKDRLDAMRAEQQARGLPTGYDRRCRYLPEEDRERNEREGQPSVVRLAMPLEGVTVIQDEIRGAITYENRTQDDQVLLKSDGFPTYFLAAAADDHRMGITHILRGDDWLSSAPKLVQVFLALGCEVPKMVHLPLIVGPDRKKLSKRHGSTQFLDFVEEGYLPEALFNFICLLGWSAGDENREIFSVPELIERFSIEGISEHPAIFDYNKLKWMNGHYIRQCEPGRLIGMCLPYLRKAGLIPDAPLSSATDEEKEAYRIGVLDYVRRVIPLEQERMKVLSEVVDLVGFFFAELDFPAGYEEKAVTKWLKVPHLGALLEKEIAVFSSLPEWTPEALEAAVRQITEELGVQFAEVIHPTRVAATGRTVGPGLFETLWALGKERTISRLTTVKERA